MNKDKEFNNDDADLVIEASTFPTVSPKFTMAKWESGEGGGQDHGEHPTDTVTNVAS